MTDAPLDFDYSPAPAVGDPPALRDCYGLFIGGAWSAAHDGATAACENPATQTRLALVAEAAGSDVDRAVRAARRGYDKYWRKLRVAERAKYLYRLAGLLEAFAAEAAQLETLDAGLPIRATGEAAPSAARHVFYYAGWADKLEWALHARERARPLGVVAAVVGAGQPLQAAVAKVAPALACGNAVILKPAHATPLSALLLARLVREADLPPGAFNVVTGDAAAGAALAAHDDVDALAFAGSASTGRALRRALAGTRKRLGLTLEGATTLLVFDDAPLEAALEGASAALCTGGAGLRLLVQESIGAEFVARLGERLRGIRQGDPLDRNTDIGPLPSQRRRDLLAGLARTAVEEGATAIVAPWRPPEQGYWFPATIVAGVQPSHTIASAEPVGPLVAALTFRTIDEAIERANTAPSPLAVGVWSSSGSVAFHVANRVHAGVVACNAPIRLDPSSPYGAQAEAGPGRDGGRAGLRAYLAL